MGESQAKFVALAIVFMVLPIIAVVLRIFAKRTRGSKMAADDYLAFLALAFTLGAGVCQIIAGYIGNGGQHLTYSYSPMIPDQMAQLVNFFKVQYAFEILAQLALIFAKLSLIYLYRRIFATPTFQRASLIVGAVILAWHIAFIFAFIFQCVPIKADWDLTIKAPKCVNKFAMWKAYAISDVLTDAMVLSLPIPAVLGLQMAIKQKIAVIMIFLLGALCIATGITRTAFFFIIAHDTGVDITYTAAPTWYWSFIETSLGTICACLPTLRPLFATHSVGSVVDKVRDYMSLRSGKSQLSSSSSSAKEKSPPVSIREHSLKRGGPDAFLNSTSTTTTITGGR